MKQKDEIENLFSSEFEEFSVTPPISMKKSIDDRIFKSKIKYGYWIFGSFILLFILGFVSYNWLGKNNPKEKNVSISSANFSETEKSLENQKQRSNSNAEINHSKISSIHVIKTEIIEKELFKKNNKAHNKIKVSSERSSLNNKVRNSTITIENSRNLKNSNSVLNKNLNNIQNNSLNFEPLKDNNKTEIKDLEVSNSNLSNEIALTKSMNSTDSTLSNEMIVNLKNDSIIHKNEEVNTYLIDSTQPLEKKSKWMLSYRIGSGFGINSFSNQTDYNLTEKKTILTSIEITRILNSKYSISSGFQYEKNESWFNYSYSKIDSVFIGFDSLNIPILDSNNVIIGYNTTLTAKYNQINSKNILHSVYQLSSMSIPLYFGFSQKLTKDLSFDLNSGLIVSYQKYKLISGDSGINDPTIQTLGLKLCLRPQLRYQVKQFGFSLSTGLGYDLFPTLNWSDTKRKRFYSSLLVGIHYTF